MKKVISFSLWGDNPKYTVGAIKNIELAKKFYADWVCRFYVGKSTPISVIEKIISYDNTELKIMNTFGDWSGMFWRFYAAVDPEVDLMISRDTDSRLSNREKLAVDRWIDSNKGFHIMRDHPYHATEILGGMFGIRKNCIPNLYNLINDYAKEDFWQIDQNFLREKIYPLIKNNSYVNDPFFEKKPFPSARINKEFIGEIYDEDNNRNKEHYLLIPD